MEGFDGQCKPDGGQPDRSGAKYSAGNYGGGNGRPFAEDNSRGKGRNPPVERHDEQDGGPA